MKIFNKFAGSGPTISDNRNVNNTSNNLPTQHINIDNRRSSSGQGWWNIGGTLSLIAGAIIIAGILNFFVFQQYQVDGPSMQTTLQTGNRLIVYKVPRTWARITGHAYIPKRGDIVVFIENNLYGLDETGSNQLIKRVIGLPGDRVVVSNGVLTIFNKQHPNGFRPDATLPYGKVIGTTSGNIDITVPPNQIFVCGDNRGDSLDSRIFGTVPAKNIIGQLVVRITPLNEIKKF
ncbi:MAG TPA: signal peptidase I [Candidatus Saccharimonadales bacterium]|nr:signal peptidase I [Candidatus Saccharimonadales bacterium]